MTSQVPFEQHRKLLLSIAHRVKRRMYAAGDKSVQLEDIFQELVIAWCKARDKWEPTHNVPFGAYLMRGMSNHINRWVDRELRQRNIAPFDLDAEFSGEEEGTLHDILADEMQPTPEEAVIAMDIRDYAKNPLRWRQPPAGWRQHKELTPNAKKFVELLADPPMAIMQIFHGLQARAEFARKTLKIHSAVGPTRITGSFILDVMGVSDRTERADIYNQVKVLNKRVSQQ